MSVVAECLSHVRLGEPQIHDNLALFPLFSKAHVEPRYTLLDEALEQGSARVTEVSESGNVPELKFVNDGEQPVLLLDGEELVGAKQNRILNLTVLAPARQTIVIPVSCVEAGRWRANSAEFASARRAHYAAGRAGKAAQVSESMYRKGTRDSDQGEVWANISGKAARMGAHSNTGAAAALYEKYQARLKEYYNAFTALDNQTGALFVIGGEAVGLDLFDSPVTLKTLLPKLVQSYALDAIDAGDKHSKANKSNAAKLIKDAVGTPEEHFPAVGEGEDLRLRGDELSGGALSTDGGVVHLCVFRLQSKGNGNDGYKGSRLVRSSLRRNG